VKKDYALGLVTAGLSGIDIRWWRERWDHPTKSSRR